jgi:hypothetical protein
LELAVVVEPRPDALRLALIRELLFAKPARVELPE